MMAKTNSIIRHQLKSLTRDKANENQSADLHKFCEERCIAERYSTPYEQDGAAEVSIRVLGRPTRAKLAGT